VGCNPLPSLGSLQDMAAWPSRPQEVAVSQVAGPPRFFPTEMEVLSVGQRVGSLCVLCSLPGPPFLLGNGELIRPAVDLPSLISAERAAEPKLPMLEPRLAADECLLHRTWSRVAQRSSRTGCACLWRSGDILLATIQLCSPPRERAQGSHESALL